MFELVKLPFKIWAEVARTTLRVGVTMFGVPVALAPLVSSLLHSEAGGSVAHPFLSDAWIEAARKIREEFRGKQTITPPVVKLNLVVTEVPFGSGTLDAHSDTSSGDLEMDLGHIDGADAKITVPYETAKALLIDQDQQAAMQAFMSGQVKIEGDMMKLMGMQTTQVDAAALEAAARIKAITV